MTLCRLLRLLVLLVLSTAAAPAAEASTHRMMVEATEYPWSAVGRLNVAGHSYCTAVLVSERHVLTAAHCLWNHIDGRWWPAAAVHFVAGYQRGIAPVHSVLKSYVVADGYIFSNPPVHADTDWALAELVEPLGQGAGWIGVASLSASDGRVGQDGVIGQLGYRVESRHALSLDYGCRILDGAAAEGGVFWDDCQAVHGDSGGPVLAFRPDGPKVVGITVMSGLADGRLVTGVVNIAMITETRRSPKAARAAIDAGIGRRSGQPPKAGAPMARLPVKTVGNLDRGGRSAPSLAVLTRLLAKAAADP